MTEKGLRLLTYPGVKTKELAHIERDLKEEDFDTFVDVFSGSGCVGYHFLRKYNCEVVFNDKDKNVIDMYEEFFDDNKSFISEFKTLASDYKDAKDKVDFYKQTYQSNKDEPSGPKFLFINKLSFRGMGGKMPNAKSVDGKMVMGRKSFSDEFFDEMKSFYREFKNKDKSYAKKDFKKVLAKYKNDERTVLYLDPPYIKRGGMEYNNTLVCEDLQHIRDFMSECKCKVILHIDYNAYCMEDLFKPFFKFCYPLSYNMAGDKKNKLYYANYHCVFRNY